MGLFDKVKTEDEFYAVIEKMMVDTKKGLASNKEFLSGFAEALAKHEMFQKHLGDIPTLKTQITSLEANIKALKSCNFDPIKDENKNYKGVWGNLKQCRDFGLFVLASVNGHKPSAEKLKSMGYELKEEKAMGEDANSTGGILVPTDFIANLILLVEKYGVFRQNVNEYPMASDRSLAPKFDSGLTVYCPGAGNVITASDIGLKAVELVAKKWATITFIDSELDEDSAIAVGELVGRMIAMAFAKKEDEVGFLGDGTSTYFGHMGITGALRKVDATIANIKSLTVGDGNAYSELTLANFEDVVGNLPDFAEIEGEVAWYNSRKLYYSTKVKLAMAAGGAKATEILSGAGSRQKTFLGYPEKFCAAMPKVTGNSQICSIFGNLRLGAYLGSRRQMSVAQSTEIKFAEDQIAIRGTERVAPSVHGVGDTTNAGPICGLITAGS